MDPWRKRLKLWKLNLLRTFPFLRFFPYLLLVFFLFTTLSTFKNGLFTKKSDHFLSDLAPGEIIPTKNIVTKPQDSYYDTVFKRLFKEGYISRSSKVLSVGSTSGGLDVVSLKKLGVSDVTGILDLSHSLGNNTFDFEFFGYSTRFKFWTASPGRAASEISRTLKVGGYVAIQLTINDEYSYDSFINLFPYCSLVSSGFVKGLELSVPLMYELVFKKEAYLGSNDCTISEMKRRIIDELEPLEQPKHGWDGPWGDGRASMKYLPFMVDLSFKERYIYIDVGSHFYSSSIGNWFNKEYPKQNKPFEIYAIEPDKAFHEEYKSKNGLSLLPYAAWIKNETLKFEVIKVPPEFGDHQRMGFLQAEKQEITRIPQDNILPVVEVEAFDFAEWVLRTVTKRDFVVVKMDVEGAEVKLLKRLKESGALCLIDELFLECHFDRFDDITLFKGTESECTEIFKKLREEGNVVHQWW